MYLDVESMVTLNALRRAEIYEEVVGPYRVRQPWSERMTGRPVGRWQRTIQALRMAVGRLHIPAPLKQLSL